MERAPKHALELLDRHKAELHEAFEAGLALGQRSQVLGLLDGASPSDMAASQALLLMRGQLRAAASRCSEGIEDFNRVLASGGRPSKQALLGRALRRKRLGDTVGAQSDMERYRRALPDGPAVP